MSLGRVAGATDTGRKRRRNEDAYVVLPPLFAIADGMGGAQAGEVASRLAAAALEESNVGGGGEEQVARLIQEANSRVHTASTEDAAKAGMGTTMTVALVENGTVAIGHVGDSRAYLLRDGELEQLTDDHTLVAELMRSGKLSPEEARIHPQRSVITRALGSDPDVDVDTYTIETRTGDVFLLCSDGLSSMVDDDVIQETLQLHRGDLDAAVKALVKQALRGGGEDNITVVAFEIADAADAAEELEKTREQALPPAPPEDDEDTLDELDGVRTVGDTMVLSAAEIQTAAAGERRPERKQRRGILAPVLLILLVALIVVLAVWGLTR
jgi:serine/threonine protein phosphatase PrpC